MYDFLRGIIESKQPDGLVLDVGGVGYFITASPRTLSEAGEIGKSAKLYTKLIVREDARELYGFTTREQKRMFMRLTAISGVGPKSALALLGQMSVQEFLLAVAAQDAKTIAKTPGLGLKTAQKIILELADKLGKDEFIAAVGAGTPSVAAHFDDVTRDAVDALVNLGYQSVDAAKAVARAKSAGAKTADELIRAALRDMAF